MVTVTVMVLMYKKRQKQRSENITMAPVVTPLNTVETLKEEGIYESIDDYSLHEKDTSLQETTNGNHNKPTKEAESLSPVMMKENVVYGAAAAAGYGGGIAPVAMMDNTSYSIIGAGGGGVAMKYEAPTQQPATPAAEQ